MSRWTNLLNLCGLITILIFFTLLSRLRMDWYQISFNFAYSLRVEYYIFSLLRFFSHSVFIVFTDRMAINNSIVSYRSINLRWVMTDRIQLSRPKAYQALFSVAELFMRWMADFSSTSSFRFNLFLSFPSMMFLFFDCFRIPA